MEQKAEFFGIKIDKSNAEKTRQALLSMNLLETGFGIMRSADFVIFPLKRKPLEEEEKELKKKVKSFAVNRMFFSHAEKQPKNLKSELREKLSAPEFEKLVSGFDTLGNIAIIEIPKELEKKEKLIAEALLKTNKAIKTVCKKLGAHKGTFRIEPVKIIAGEKNLIAEYRESGCIFEIPVGKVFFSPRLATERMRIAGKIKKGEVIGAFFAGVGPFPIVFAKNSEMKKAVAIELNPKAVEYMKKNIELNKAEEKIEPVLGDVKKIAAKKFENAFDRIVMPLPKGGEDFLKEAMLSAKEKGIIHFYGFVKREKPFTETIEMVKKTAEGIGKKIKILGKKQVREFSKETIQIVVDFEIFSA